MDQLFNTLLGLVFLFVFMELSFADETLSARSWRESKTSKAWNIVRILIDALFWFDPQHCFQSYLSEFERKHLPEEYAR